MGSSQFSGGGIRHHQQQQQQPRLQSPATVIHEHNQLMPGCKSEDMLDRLETAGRVPSKEKYRRMVCNVRSFLR
jgi:hypothetical protein